MSLMPCHVLLRLPPLRFQGLCRHLESGFPSRRRWIIGGAFATATAQQGGSGGSSNATVEQRRRRQQEVVALHAIPEFLLLSPTDNPL